jgi:hypothetical protein
MPYLLLLAVEGEPLEDATRDIARPRVGDCIGVFPDTHAFGAMERDNPMFEIVKVPGVVTDYDHLVETEAVDTKAGLKADAAPVPWRKRRIDMQQIIAEKTPGRAKTDAKIGQYVDLPVSVSLVAAEVSKGVR